MNHKPLALTLLLPLALHAQDNAADPALTIPEPPPAATLLDDTTITSEPLPAPGAA